MYVDTQGVPYSDYGVYRGIDIGRQRSLLSVAERGLWCWNEFDLSGGGDRVLLSYDWSRWPVNRDANPGDVERARAALLSCARWLLEAIQARDNHLIWVHPYPISYETRPGWASAHTQAVALQLFVRTTVLTDDARYAASVPGLLRAFSVPVRRGGLLDDVGPYAPWFEKFADPENQRPKVLNGMLFTLLGLRDVAARTGGMAAREAYESGLEAVLRAMPAFDLGDWSAYDIFGKRASSHYHDIHVEQLALLHEAERDPRLAQWRDLFATYARRRAARVINSNQRSTATRSS